MIEHLKKIISSDLIINDKPYSIEDNFQYPWQSIANIDTFFKDIESSFSEIDNLFFFKIEFSYDLIANIWGYS